MSLSATLSTTPASTGNAAPVPNSSNASGSGGSSSSNGNNNNSTSLPFEKDKIWYFSNDQLGNSPSRRCGIKSDDELHYRQMTAYLIQEMGQRLQVSQLCINTAIVYMHRFYAFHSFTHFHRNSMASASLFLAAKVEEQPRKLEHVIRAANKCLPQTTEQSYADLAQELVFNENVLLQTLGFDVAIDHPHTHVVRTCQLVKACKDLAQTSYFLASNSLHLTSMCLQYRPTVVACFCIYLACKWSRWEIPQSTEGKHWFYYVDKSVSLELLKQLTDEFIAIYEKSPARLKSKLNSIKAIAQGASNRTSSNKDNKQKEEWKMSEMMKGYHSNITAPPELMNGNDSREQSQAALLPPPTTVPSQQQRRSDQSNHLRQSSSVSAQIGSSMPKMSNYQGTQIGDIHADKSKPSGFSNRVPSSHQANISSATQRASSGNAPSSSSNNQRSANSQQASRSSLPMDYHKSSRGIQPIGIQSHAVHKLPSSSKQQQPVPQLQDVRSNLSVQNLAVAPGVSSKEIGKVTTSSSKIYPNALPPFNNSATTNQLVSRGGYPSGAGNGGSTGVPPALPGGYNQTSHRSKPGIGSYDQQLPYNQSQPMSSYGHIQHHTPLEVAPSSTMTQQQQQQQQLNKNNSLFSPEWNETKKESHFNGLLHAPAVPAHDSLGYKVNNHVRDRDSPKKDRLTPTKKDKHRTTFPLINGPAGITAKSFMPPHKKAHGEANELSVPGRDGNMLKRPNDICDGQYGLNKIDEQDGNQQRDKTRKMDSSIGVPGFNSYEEKHTALSMSNGGIETTPDLVRSLLKESLCTTNASLLKPDALTMPGLKPPAELLEPMPPAMQFNNKRDLLQTVPTNSLSTAPNLEQETLVKGDDEIRDPECSIKAEKKKKKDKHKHKEKDKTKDKSDREERKKHKKDKQKERGIKDPSLKLVIKTSSSGPNANGSLQVDTAAPLKLKISKNKLEPTNYSADGLPPVAVPSPPDYGQTSSSTTTTLSQQQPVLMPGILMPSYGSYSSASNNSNNTTNSSSSSSSGKRKHGDRDRDKETKKSKTQDYAKYNGVPGGAVYTPLGGAGAASIPQASVSSLLVQPQPISVATAGTLLTNSIVMAPASLATTPSALPYNKK
ncbi:CycT [Drosophila busckii]|uniref:CycT n=1 Tax=Drosophila busckii TaxID=30019 RepID=A0A0M3QVT9_DROBS|nr:cyclin-T [Drosophila busckii]ALC42983.1 CycT [Drosophila busckii]